MFDAMVRHQDVMAGCVLSDVWEFDFCRSQINLTIRKTQPGDLLSNNKNILYRTQAIELCCDCVIAGCVIV